MQFSTVPTDNEAPASLAEYIPVAVALLRRMGNTGCDLYVADETGGPPILLSGRDFGVAEDDFTRLDRRGVTTLYVTRADHRRFKGRLNDCLDDIIGKNDLDPADGLSLLQTAVADEIQHAFQRVSVDEAVKQSARVGSYITGLLGDNDAVPSRLFQVMRHDYYTFTHVINVSSYCVMLATRLGVQQQDELEEVAIGGMLHDVGKRGISKAIINKPGRLTDVERDVMRQHPTIGYVDLLDRDEVRRKQLMMVYQHHERVDGCGYPVGIPGPEIHHLARICAVVDVFDAVTSSRSYREPMTVADALTFLEDQAGKHLDEDMVKCWTAAMRS